MKFARKQDQRKVEDLEQDEIAEPPHGDDASSAERMSVDLLPSSRASADLFGNQYSGAASVQRKTSHDGEVEAVNEDRLVPGSGTPLAPEVLRDMQSRFGADFSSVRIHTDDAATQALGAEAYTTGNNIVFASGNYAPETQDGQRRLAHELTHVLQQSEGAVDGTDIGNGVQVSDPSDSFERAAESTAERIVASGTANIGGGATAAWSSANVQRRVVQRREQGSKVDKAFKGVKSACDLAEKVGDMVPDAVKEKAKEWAGKLPESVQDLGKWAGGMACGIADPKTTIKDVGKDIGKDGLTKGAEAGLEQGSVTGGVKAGANALLESCSTNDRNPLQGVCALAQLAKEAIVGAPEGQKTLAERVSSKEVDSPGLRTMERIGKVFEAMTPMTEKMEQDLIKMGSDKKFGPGPNDETARSLPVPGAVGPQSSPLGNGAGRVCAPAEGTAPAPDYPETKTERARRTDAGATSRIDAVAGRFS